MKIAVSVIPPALIDNNEIVENGPANPVPALKSPTNLCGKPLRNPSTVHSPILYETPMNILQKMATKKKNSISGKAEAVAIPINEKSASPVTN